jgi:hypothetical protein
VAHDLLRETDDFTFACVAHEDGDHIPLCDRLTAALEARDAEHAAALASVRGALDVARDAFLDLGRTFHSGEHMTCCVQCGLPVTVCDVNTHLGVCRGHVARAALARIAQLLGEAP